MSVLNWPNRITLARIVLIAPLIICLLNLNTSWEGWRYTAIALFGLMALSDALDGYLARRLSQETMLGRFLDPVGDKLLVVSAVILLAIDATAVHGFKIPSWVAVIAISKDILTVIGSLLVYVTTHEIYIRPRILGKACTLVQLLMVAYVLVAPDLPGVLQGMLMPLCLLASGLAVIAAADYIRIGSRFVSETQSL